MKEAWVLTHLRSIQFNCCCRRRRHQTRTWFGMTRLTECEKGKERTDTHWWDTRVCCLVEGKPVRCDRIHAIWFVRSLVRLCHYFECVQHTKLKCNIDCSRRQKRETPLFPQQMFCLSFALVGCLLNHFSFIPHHHHHHLFRSLVGFNENGVGLRRGGGQEKDRTYITKRGDTILWERVERLEGIRLKLQGWTKQKAYEWIWRVGQRSQVGQIVVHLLLSFDFFLLLLLLFCSLGFRATRVSQSPVSVVLWCRLWWWWWWWWSSSSSFGSRSLHIKGCDYMLRWVFSQTCLKKSMKKTSERDRRWQTYE